MSKRKIIIISLIMFVIISFAFWVRKNETKKSLLLPYKEIPPDILITNTTSYDFNFDKYIENNTVKTSTTTGNVLGYKIDLITKEDEYGIALNTTFHISKNGKKFYEIENQRFNTINKNYKESFLETAEDFINFALLDITSNDIPEFIFEGWSGGAHCCYTVYVIELSEPLLMLWKSDEFDKNDQIISLIDDNENDAIELKTKSQTSILDIKEAN